MLASPPEHDPSQALTLRDLSDFLPSAPKPRSDDNHLLGPFATKSAFDLAEWYWNTTTKSFTDFQKLIGILKQPGFDVKDVANVNWKAAFKALGSNASDLPEADGAWIQDDGWLTTPITIDVPFHHRLKDRGVKPYLACKFRHRSILSVIKEKVGQAADSSHFHYHPFKAAWKRTSESVELELFGELYASRAFREADENVQRRPSNPENEGMERVVVGLMIWSDATQLTSFGNTSLWPCYLFFGNDSKYLRCRPSERLGLQIAYFNKVGTRDLETHVDITGLMTNLFSASG